MAGRIGSRHVSTGITGCCNKKQGPNHGVGEGLASGQQQRLSGAAMVPIFWGRWPGPERGERHLQIEFPPPAGTCAKPPCAHTAHNSPRARPTAPPTDEPHTQTS